MAHTLHLGERLQGMEGKAHRGGLAGHHAYLSTETFHLLAVETGGIDGEVGSHLGIGSSRCLGHVGGLLRTMEQQTALWREHGSRLRREYSGRGEEREKYR